MLRSLVLLIFFVLCGSLSFGQLVDSEVLPGGTGVRPSDGMLIAGQWRDAPFFLQFSLEGPGAPPAPQIAWAGGVATAFDGANGGTCDVTTADMPAANPDVECTFLTDDGIAGAGGRPYTVHIGYGQPVMEASGVLLDVDGFESYRIQAFDELDTEIVGVFVDVNAATPGSGNGLATSWGLVASDSSRPIYGVRITYTGPTTGDLGDGVSFDTFAPTTLCPDLVTHRPGGLRSGGNRLPRISPGCPQVGQPGQVHLFNAPGGAAYCLVFSTATGLRPFGNCGTAEVVMNSANLMMNEGILNGPAGIAGAGSVTIPYNVLDVSLTGISFTLQAGFADTTVSCGFSLSEPVEVKL